MLSDPNQFLSVFPHRKTAVLVDLSFFLKVFYSKTREYPEPDKVANDVRQHVLKTLRSSRDYLFRVFVYDCPPITGRGVKKPVSGELFLLNQNDSAEFRKELLDQLKQKPYFSVRLGRLHFDRQNPWVLKPEKTDKLFDSEFPQNPQKLMDNDFKLNLRQKEVDMKIGLDIASLAIKKQVEKIVLITNDSDFVPAIKFAKQEGVIVQLDPLRQDVPKSLSTHIDLLRSVYPCDGVFESELSEESCDIMDQWHERGDED